MLKFLMITVVALQSLPHTRAFLDHCPIDRELKIDDVPLINVLEIFYNDLAFIEAVTESRQDRNYTKVLEELTWIVSSGIHYRQIDQMVQLLNTGHFAEATRRWNMIYWDQRDSLQVRSYLHYFRADTQRLMEHPIDASAQILDAINVRQRSSGVSVNDLEKLDGLVTLQRVSHFNRAVDFSYNLRTSPDFELLSTIHSVLKDDMSPLSRIRSAISDQLFASPIANEFPRESASDVASMSEVEAGPFDGMSRVDPSQDDFGGQSTSKRAAEGILCEFAQKLSILGSISYDDNEVKLDYASLMQQLAELDADFARVFNEDVVRRIEDGQGRLALRNVVSFWSMLDSSGSKHLRRRPSNYPYSSGYEHGKMLETYAKYFRIEIYRRQSDHCTYLKQIEMLLDRIKDARQERRGVSLDKILELEGKIVALSLTCFHQRIRAAYQLSGAEDEQQLRAKREEFGSVDTYFPQTDIPF